MKTTYVNADQFAEATTTLPVAGSVVVFNQPFNTPLCAAFTGLAFFDGDGNRLLSMVNHAKAIAHQRPSP